MQVLALFDQVMARLGDSPAVPFLEAVQSVSEAITRVLLDSGQSDILKQTAVFDVAAGAVVLLPADFAGFRSLPWSISDRRFLEPLTDAIEMASTGGSLSHYDLRGFKFSLFPAQPVTKQIKISYTGTPEPLIEMSDDLPFDGLFDFIFRDASVRVAMDGITLTSDPAFLRFITDKVGEVVNRRQPAVPRRNGYFD